MKNRISNLMWGLFWVVIGVLILGNTFQWWSITWFFAGWWTLFIIIPCFISMIGNGFGSFSTVGFAIGVMLLLNCQGVIENDALRKLMIPMVLILVGILLILKNILSDFRKVEATYGKEDCHAATFSTIRCVASGEKYNGGELDSVFGSLTLDLRNTQVTQNIVIRATSIFGGINIYAPKDVKIKVNSTTFFGGVSNKAQKASVEGCPIIYVDALCMFGGVDIK